MIAQLRGIVLELSGNVAVLDVQGVGYEVICSSKCLAQMVVAEEVAVVIYTEVKEDSIRLYGFEDRLEREVFTLLIAVKGVGARSASEIVSRIEKRDLLRAIGEGDVTRLQGVKGIGKKTAERIVVELRDKVASYIEEQRWSRLGMEIEVTSSTHDAIEALQALGFPRREAEQAVKRVELAGGIEKMESGQIVKEALKFV
ncbi:Holliday junction branch migration protein RuvA [Oligoflexia bacterium]|nr:Holliday junction branch migration protein RuvA [Oligoflexia bacterium]